MTPNITGQMAKYPFFPESKEAVREVSPESIVTDENIIERAKDRIISGIDSGNIGKATNDYRVELLSYPVSRILVSLLGENYVTKQYAQAEASSAVEKFRDDLSEDGSEYLSETLELKDIRQKFDLEFNEVNDIKELFNKSNFAENWKKSNSETRVLMVKGVKSGIPITEEDAASTENVFDNFIQQDSTFETHRRKDQYYYITVEDYLRYTKDINEEKWNLTNRTLVDGEVLVQRKELFDIIEAAFFERIYENLPMDVPSAISEKLESEVSDLEEKLPDEVFFGEIEVVEEGAFPPVIKMLMERIQKGKFVSHEERLIIATFLIHLGMSNDEIIEMLQTNPNFDEETRYQLDHLRNRGEGGEPYTPPTYDTIEAWGIEWDKDELEDKVSHPLTYYRVKLEEEGIDPTEPLEEAREKMSEDNTENEDDTEDTDNSNNE